MNVAVNRSLARHDFPFTIWAYRTDDDTWCWGVTLLEPPGRKLVPLRIPPLARWEGVPVYIETITAEGIVSRQAPAAP